MKKFISLAAVVVAVAAIAPVAALADDPLAKIQADITQLKTDVQAKHDTVVADAAKLEADATSLVGSDRKTARETIKADAQKLTTDWKSLLATCLKDRAQLRADVIAAKQDGSVKRVALGLLIRQANLEIRLTNLDMRAAVAKAHLAVVKLRQSFAAAGQQAPNVPTPPTTTSTPAPITP